MIWLFLAACVPDPVVCDGFDDCRRLEVAPVAGATCELDLVGYGFCALDESEPQPLRALVCVCSNDTCFWRDRSPDRATDDCYWQCSSAPDGMPLFEVCP